MRQSRFSSRTPSATASLSLPRLAVAQPSLETGPRLRTGIPLRHLRSALVHWHLFSLDAPTVTVLWTALFARSFGLPADLGTLFPLFLAVWILYAADRLLDARLLTSRTRPVARPHLPGHPLEPRHRFHHTHRRGFRRALVLASLLLAGLIPRLPTADLRLDLLLAASLALYFLLLHTGSARGLHVPLPKELVVGLSFATAATIPTLAQHPDLLRPLFPSALLFAALCTLNCLLIHAWEHSPRTRLPLFTLAVLLALGSLATALSQHSLLPLAITLSALLLLVLDRLKHHFTPTPLRAAADLALLTPALFLLLTLLGAGTSRLEARGKKMPPNFDFIARPYHLLERLSFGAALGRARLHFLPDVLETRRVLVLGDGDGRFLAQLLQHAPNLLRADAVDLSPRMLDLLDRRCHRFAPVAYPRLHLHCTDALSYLHDRPHTRPAFDLVVTHFFLDCLSEADLRRLAADLAPHLAPDALWLRSDFHIPDRRGPARIAAQMLVRSLYLAFRLVSGLEITRLPDHAAILRSVGHLPVRLHASLAGLLTSELWKQDRPFPNRRGECNIRTMPNSISHREEQNDETAPIEPVYDIDPLMPMPHSPTILPAFSPEPPAEQHSVMKQNLPPQSR